jgi:uncharacterized membrane protein
MKSKLNWLEVLLLATPLIVLALYWNDLPPRVPTHWNFRAQIDGWSPKLPGLLLFPIWAIFLTALLHFLPWLDPKLRRTGGTHGRMPAVLPILRIVLLGLFDMIFFVQIAASLGMEIPSGRIVMCAMLLAFVVLGNYLGNLRPNYFVGIRTPWTLEDPATWRATHRLGGRLMFFGGLILLVLQFFLDQPVFSQLFTASIVVLAIWGIAYSWHHSRTHAATE